MSEYRWRSMARCGKPEFESVIASIGRTLPVARGALDEWRLLCHAADASRNEFQVMVLEQDDRIVGCAPFVRHRVRLDFSLGEITLFSVATDRAALDGGLLIAWDQLGSYAGSCLVELFRELRAVSGKAVVFLRGVERTGPLNDVVTGSRELRKYFHVVPHGPDYQRCFARIGEGYDTYLSSLGKNSRHDLRRTRKRFLEELDGRYRLCVYTSTEDVARLAEDAEIVSRKTYQWHLLGQRVGRGGTVEEMLRVAAEHDILLSYVLFVDAEPVAFQIGYRFGRVYSAHQTGFDPQWRKWQPGIFLLTEIFLDISRTPDLELFDFQVGDSLEKSRLSNLSRQERHFYLFPASWRGAMLAYTKLGVDAASSSMGRVAHAFGIKDLVKRRLRRRATAAK